MDQALVLGHAQSHVVLDDNVVFADGQDVLATQITAQRHFGHQDTVRYFFAQELDADKQTGEEVQFFIRQAHPQLDRSGVAVHFVVDEVDDASERKTHVSCASHKSLAAASATLVFVHDVFAIRQILQYQRFRRVKIDVDGLELVHPGQQGRAALAHEVARIDQVAAGHPFNG